MISQIKKLIPERYHPDVWVSSHCDTLSVVAAGPFAGLQYPDDELRPHFSARLLGTYELELQALIEQLCAKNYSTIIDIGAAEGYYAVGFCRRCPQLQMVAFEAEEYKQNRLVEIAQLNGVTDRLTIGGLCSTEDLRQTLQNKNKVLIFCDIEGGEGELLNPDLIPDLYKTTILVELHDIFPEFADVATVMRERFEHTHEISEILGQDRTLADLPFSVPPLFRNFYTSRLMLCMDEKRPENMHWYFMEPRNSK